jgi:hypothetical protein
VIVWLLPIGFGAFAALAIPLIVHWVRRSERRLVPFAAMRYLREHPYPRENRRLHERGLLALRLLLLAGLALLLAWPVWRGRPEPASAPWVIVAPGVSRDAAHAALDAPAAEWHWLEPGAPMVSRLRELDATVAPGTAMSVLVPEEIGGLDAERLRLAHAVSWRAVPGSRESPSTAADSPSAAAAAPLRLAVRYDAEGESELGVVHALVAAWTEAGSAPMVEFATSGAAPPPTGAWLIWLGGPLSPSVTAWIRAGGRAFASRQPNDPGETALRDETGSAVLRERRLGAGWLLTLATPLRTDALPALLSPQFPQSLRSVFDAAREPPDRAPAASVAPLSLTGTGAAAGADRAPRGRERSLAAPLALLLALAFLIERVLATRRRS